MAQVAVPGIGKQAGQAALAIPPAGSPNGGFSAVQAGSDSTLPLPGSDSQHNPGS